MSYYVIVGLVCVLAGLAVGYLVAKKVKEENGSIICRELLGGAADNSSTPTPRTENYYKKRPCGEYVRIAAEIAENVINEMGL